MAGVLNAAATAEEVVRPVARPAEETSAEALPLTDDAPADIGVYVSTTWPTPIFDPATADSVSIRPAKGAGTSIVALSESTSIKD